MKIRAYIVRINGTGTDPIYREATSRNPVGVEWISYHYRPGANRGLVIVAAADTFDFAPISALAGVRALPSAALDTRIADLPQDRLSAFRTAFEAEIGPLDTAGIEDYEDLLCAVLRAIGETGRRKLRYIASQRTRGFLDSFNG